MGADSLILREPIGGLPCWRGADLVGDSSWRTEFAAADLATIETSVASLRERRVPLSRVTTQDMPLPAFEAAAPALAEQLENGRGFFIVGGLDPRAFADGDLDVILYGVGQHLGAPVCQDERGTLIGRVENIGDPDDKTTRVYETNRYLPYHADPSDVFALLCVRKAKAGGLTSLVSTAAVYNRFLADHPEYLALLHRPLHYAHLGPAKKTPIFSHHDGKIAVRYLRQYIELGHELANVELSRVEVEALDCFDAILADPSMRFDVMLEPGEVLFANNYAVMHSRNAFVDHDDPAQRRKLLRLWLKMPNARTLSPDFPGRNGYGLPG